MDVVVTGRNIDVTDRFREHVTSKVSKLEKHDRRIIRVNVEVSKEKNPRQADRAVKVQLTLLSKGPVVRAEAAADDKMGALDLAVDKLEAQARRASDRRRTHRRKTAPVGTVDEALAPEENDDEVPVHQEGPITVTGEGPLVVREKVHEGAPMGLDQALYEMELVGHDFFLFVDKQTERPSVVYRRRGYDYGVIALDVASGQV